MEQVMNHLSKHRERPLFIAIEGHSAAGKSTLANRIAEAKDEVTIIHTDDFYRVMPEAERFHLTPEEGYERYYDWQRLKDVLKTLGTGRLAEYKRYDWSANKLGETVNIKPEGIIIVEGCYSLRPELCPFYGLRFYVEAPSTLRLERQRNRDDNSVAWIARWHAAESYHFIKNAPEKYADLVLSEGAA